MSIGNTGDIATHLRSKSYGRRHTMFMGIRVFSVSAHTAAD